MVDLDVEANPNKKDEKPEIARDLKWLECVLKHQATVLGRIFPHIAASLRAVVYDASGLSQQKGLQKVSGAGPAHDSDHHSSYYSHVVIATTYSTYSYLRLLLSEKVCAQCMQCLGH